MFDSDYQFALQLQKQFEHEENIETGSNLVYKRNNSNQRHNSSKSLVDPSWELIDPTPDIHSLFVIFDKRFFWNKLNIVCVSWSKKMTSCAGICYYQGRGGLCSITISEPLLKLRPRKDLIETLLHEMIHAYLFVTHNNRDRDGHGPEFRKHMHRINSEAGTDISVYHDFHDEVRLYQQHWWRCNGLCQKWKPYFGIVRRATNRAPGPNDYWWGEHSRNCGGTFIKIKEPENYKKKNPKKENIKPATSPKSDLRNYFDNTQNRPKVASNFPSQIIELKDLMQNKTVGALKNSSNTIVITKRSNSSKVQTKSNKDSNSSKPFLGEGKYLIGSRTETDKENKDYSTVRNHWINKFQNIHNLNNKRNSSYNIEINTKRQKTNPTSSSTSAFVDINQSNSDNVDCPVCGIYIKTSLINEHLDKCLMKSKEKTEEFCFICGKSVLKKDLKSHINSCLNQHSIDGEIKCNICGKLLGINKYSEHYKNCLNDVFSEDTDFSNQDLDNSEVCLICNERIKKSVFNKHAEQCLHSLYEASEVVAHRSNSVEILEDKCNLESECEVPCLVCGQQLKRSQLGIHLDDCMEQIFANATSTADDNNPSSANEKFNCPFCLKPILQSEMNRHLDLCFSINEA